MDFVLGVVWLFVFGAEASDSKKRLGLKPPVPKVCLSFCAGLKPPIPKSGTGLKPQIPEVFCATAVCAVLFGAEASASY